MSWTGLFGAISLIRFGHFKNVIDDVDEFFRHVLGQLATTVLGFAPAPVTGARA
jgi:hypothetical protein